MKKQEASLESCVDYCGYFSGDHVVITGWLHDAVVPVEKVELLCGGVPVGETTLLRGARPDVTRYFRDVKEKPWGFVLIGSLPPPVEAKPVLGLQLQAGAETAQLDLAATPQTSIEALMACLEHFDEKEREAVKRALAKPLGLREDLEADEDEDEEESAGVDQLDGFVRVHVDHASVVSSNGVGLFFFGWLVDPEDIVEELQVQVGEWTSDNLLPQLERLPRADVDQAFPDQARAGKDAGFLAFVLIDQATTELSTAKELKVQIVTQSEESAWETFPLAKPASALEHTKPLLQNLNMQLPRGFDLLDQHLGPAVKAAWLPPSKAETGAPFKAELHEFGALPPAPKRTVIVPLYGRYDFLYFQLSQFCLDPDFQETDLLYVVDDPSIYPGVISLARDVAPIFNVPFRVLHAGKNLGFAGANNLGASHARGPMLLLLNSDVLPAEPGWLTKLEAHYAMLPVPGAMGVRLLYQDGTIQHDGMRFYRNSFLPGLWLNEHPGKSLPEWMAPTEPVVEMPLVTAACLLISKELYQKVDGLDEGYVLGDFEDSDLCLKLIESGHKNYLVRTVKLYHLERQSQALFENGGWRFNITIYNAWRQLNRWSKVIERLQETP